MNLFSPTAGIILIKILFKKALIIIEIINKPLGKEGGSSWGGFFGGSQGDPPGGRLFLQPQQTVRNALLVPRQAHPDLLDITVNEGENPNKCGVLGWKGDEKGPGGNRLWFGGVLRWECLGLSCIWG